MLASRSSFLLQSMSPFFSLISCFSLSQFEWKISYHRLSSIFRTPRCSIKCTWRSLVSRSLAIYIFISSFKRSHFHNNFSCLPKHIIKCAFNLFYYFLSTSFPLFLLSCVSSLTNVWKIFSIRSYLASLSILRSQILYVTRSKWARY